ncbi:MAG: 2-C-methyl-D-erythritol 2,4-cyclodiphosphate synthase [Planctomycetes bacterium]|nr:2-C-methyl-D-erythritol 2,4-cyclodiphosphate synthase [Planctomycetota bacterium]
MLGLGFDIHRLVHGREFILGGVKISYPKGLEGHSDADVLLHALIDALLGAAKLKQAGDIGDLFPNTDPSYKGIASSVLLKRTIDFIRKHKRKFKVGEVDSIVFLEEPKLGKKKMAIANKIARLLKIPANRVSVKAKTMERLGPIGHKKAVAALVLVIIN